MRGCRQPIFTPLLDSGSTSFDNKMKRVSDGGRAEPVSLE